MVKYDFDYTLKCKDSVANALKCNCATTGKGTICVYLRPMKDTKSGVVKRIYKNGDYQVALKFQIWEDFDFAILADVVRIADIAMLSKNFIPLCDKKWQVKGLIMKFSSEIPTALVCGGSFISFIAFCAALEFGTKPQPFAVNASILGVIVFGLILVIVGLIWEFKGE